MSSGLPVPQVCTVKRYRKHLPIQDTPATTPAHNLLQAFPKAVERRSRSPPQAVSSASADHSSASARVDHRHRLGLGSRLQLHPASPLPAPGTLRLQLHLSQPLRYPGLRIGHLFMLGIIARQCLLLCLLLRRWFLPIVHYWQVWLAGLLLPLLIQDRLLGSPIAAGREPVHAQALPYSRGCINSSLPTFFSFCKTLHPYV